MNVFCFDLIAKRLSTQSISTGPVAATKDLLTDQAYVVDGEDVRPVLSGPLDPGTWKSRIFGGGGELPSFAWARLTGDLATGATIKLFADGALYYTTPALTTGEPVRLPAQRARELEVELTGMARVTALILASSAEDLL